MSKDYNITDISTDTRAAYYVRVKYKGIEYSKVFNCKLIGNKRKALAQARAFRDDIYSTHGIPLPEKKKRKSLFRASYIPHCHKPDKAIRVGINRSEKLDARRIDHPPVIIYNASWRDRWDYGTPQNPYPRIKVFTAGSIEVITEEKELAAYSAAIDFRENYERAIRDGTFFTADPWRNWRSVFGRDCDWSTQAPRDNKTTKKTRRRG